jgi:regulatory protein
MGRSTRTGQLRLVEPPDEVAADPEPDPEAVARAICLRLLTATPKSRGQLADALRQRGVPDDVATKVLDRFVDVNLVDDSAYAENYVERRHRDRGLARGALRHELQRHGVDADTAAAALDGLDPEVELATARALVERRIKSTAGLRADKRMARLAGMLARKGYPSGTAYRIVREALAAEGLELDGSPPED